MWVQHRNGVFRSTNGANSWEDVSSVSPSVFGLTVAIHPKDPNIDWLVPVVKDECRIPVGGRLTVSRTRDAASHSRN
jgi:hypothetical protein